MAAGAQPKAAAQPGAASRFYWCNPQWLDDDIFSKTPVDLNEIKQRVAVVLGCRYCVNKNGSYGSPVAGTPPLEPTVMEDKTKDYLKLEKNPPTGGPPRRA
jgi:hypothetical protein